MRFRVAYETRLNASAEIDASTSKDAATSFCIHNPRDKDDYILVSGEYQCDRFYTGDLVHEFGIPPPLPATMFPNNPRLVVASVFVVLFVASFFLLVVESFLSRSAKTTSSTSRSTSSGDPPDSVSSSTSNSQSDIASSPSGRSGQRDDAMNKGYFGGQEAARAPLPVPTAENLHSVALRLARDAGAADPNAWAMFFESGFAAGYKDPSKKAF